MITRRELKRATWAWDDNKQSLFITLKDQMKEVILNKVYMFSLMRFLVRVSAKGFYVKRKKEVQNES